jgi:hypothetical protein
LLFVFLPIYYKHRPSYNDHLPPQRTISLQRYLLGAFGLFVILTVTVVMLRLNDSGGLSVDNLCSLFALVILLAYHLTEKETRTVVKKHIFKLLNIVEPVFYPGRSTETYSNTTSRQLALSSLSGTAIVPGGNSTLINVSSLNNDLEMTGNISQPT